MERTFRSRRLLRQPTRLWLGELWRQWVQPLIFVLPIVFLALFALYSLPFTKYYDIGTAAFVPIAGVYDPEQNDTLSYVYTKGKASITMPAAGAGQFVVRVRMSGPSETLPLPAHMTAGSRALDLGIVQRPRVYHVLLPATSRGDLALGIESTTTRVAADARPLGVLLDWISASSVGSALPTPALLIRVLLALVLVGGVAGRLTPVYRRKLGLWLLIGISLCGVYALSRGMIGLQPVWVIAGGWLVIGVLFAVKTIDAWEFATPLRGVTTVFGVWHLSLWLLAAIAVWYSAWLYPFADALSYDGYVYDDRRRYFWYVFVEGWLHWDSYHYLSIAHNGYTFWNQRWPSIAFFPLYPLLVRIIRVLVANNIGIAALVVSHAACFAALAMLYSLVAHDFGRSIAYRTLVLLLLFPTSFFLVAGYTESLALLFVVAMVWAIRRQRWWLAGIAGGLLALTRLPGVLVTPMLLILYLQQHAWRWRTARFPWFVMLPPAGLMLFMLFQWWQFGTPTAFLQAQQQWDNHLSMPWVLPQMMVDTIQMSPDWPVVGFHSLFWLIGIVLVGLAARRLPLAYSGTALMLVLPPYLSSWPWSLTRHIQIAFPMFVALALWADTPARRYLLIVIWLPLLVLTVLLFVNGFWVA